MTHVRKTIIGVLIVIAAGAAGTLRADAIAGCIFPLVPNPEPLLDQPWGPRGLGLFLKKGVVVEYTDREGRPTRVVPRIDLWSGNGSGKPVTSLEGRAVEIPEPGRFAFGEIGNGIFEDLAQAMERHIPRGEFMVTSVKTLEHEQDFTWSDRQATAALTFRFSTGEGKPSADHRLAMYFVMLEKVSD